MSPRGAVRVAAAVAGCSLAAMLTAACGPGRRDAVVPGTAVWLSAAAAPLDLATLDRLRAGGVTTFFLEAAQVEWSGGASRLVPGGMARLPRRDRATLVVAGDRPPAGLDSDAAAAGLVQGVEALRLAAEGAGHLPAGLHFELRGRGGLAALGALLAALRDETDGRLLLSAGIGRSDLDDPELAKLAAEADFLVAFLYGQRPGDAEDPRSWDLQEVERGLQRLETLNCPYYVTAVTAGSASLRDRRGSRREVSTSFDIAQLVRDSRFELKRGFSLEGIDRQVHELRARSPLTIGDWEMVTGESIRIVRLATTNVEEFLRRCGAWSTERMLGPLFWRLPEPGERLVLTVDSLIAGLDPAPSRPQMALALEPLPSRRGVRNVRVRLTSLNDENTDLAFFEANYVDVMVTGARIADAEAGDFARYELSRDGDSSTMQALREADRVRLWVPWVAGREELLSGPIEIVARGREKPAVFTAGRFALSDGSILAIERQEWAEERAP